MAPENTVPDAIQFGLTKTDVGGPSHAGVKRMHREPTGVEKDEKDLVGVSIPASVERLSLIAQLVECETVHLEVVGSITTWRGLPSWRACISHVGYPLIV
jgi:hypothetical protein